MTLVDIAALYLFGGLVVVTTLSPWKRRVLRADTRNHPAHLLVVFIIFLALWPIDVLGDIINGDGGQ